MKAKDHTQVFFGKIAIIILALFFLTVAEKASAVLTLSQACSGANPQVFLSWDAAESTAGNFGPYTVLRNPPGGIITGSPVANTFYTDTTVANNTSYFYSVSPTPNLFFSSQTGNITTANCAPVVSVDIKANSSDGPITVTTNTDAVNLSWTSSNATSCTASGAWSGSKSTSGSQNMGTLSSIGNFVYTITCLDGSGGSAVDSVTVVSGPPSGSASAVVSCVGAPPATPEMDISWTPYPNTPNPPNRYDLFRTTPTRNLLVSSGGTSYTHRTTDTFPLVYGVAPSYQLEITDSTNIIYDAFPFGGPVPTCDATINVSTPGTTTPTWAIQPENKAGTGSGSVTVRPASGGNTYTITPQSFAGCLATVTNSLGGGSSMTMIPGGNQTFTVSYSCSPPSAPTCSLSSSPGSISSGQSSTLTWSSANATAASASASPANGQWSGSKSPVAAGSQVITNLTQTTTFYLDVSGTGGNFQCQAIVNVSTPPAPPSSVTASPGACGTGSITVSWPSVSGATSYNVLRSTTNGGPYSAIATGVAGTSYPDSGLVAGFTYYYVVQSVNTNGTSLNSSQASATAPSASCAPATPSGLTAIPGACGTGNITLSWGSVSGATSYQLFRNGVQIYSGAATSHPDSGLTAGNSYSYTVRATNGGGSSSQSSPVNATAPVNCPPGAPSTLSASAGSCGTGTINLSWPSVSGATSYNVLRSSVNGGPYSSIATGVAGTSYPDTGGLTPALTYYYVVQAVNTNGTSLNSPQANATAPSSCVAPVVSISASPTSGTVNVVNPSLTWSVANASPVPTCTASGDWSGVQAISGTNVSQGVLSSVKTYTYTLTCTNTNGTGANTATVVVSPAPTANITVTVVGAPSSATWSIPAASINGSGGNGNYPYTVTPSSGGTNYTLSAGSISGYNSSVTNSLGGGSSMTVFPGNNVSFTVTYTPTAAPFDFSLSPTNGSVSVTAGSSVQNTINVNLVSGTTQGVTLTATGQPVGVGVAYANQGCSPTCSGTLTFNVPIATTPGTYPINVSGTGGSVTRNAPPFNLVINPPVGFSVACSANPTSANVGQPVTWTATPSGGTGPYTYAWVGSDIPVTPAPSSNPYTISYSTAGVKSGSVTATDTATSATANCASQNVQVNVKPVFQEF